MRFANITRLALLELSASRARATISAAGIALGVSVLVVIAALGLGTRDVVLQEVVQTLPVNMVQVIPRTLDLGLFRAGSLFGGTALNPETLKRLESIDGVIGAYPKMEMKIPMGARGGSQLFGRRLYTDLFMIGVPPELVQVEGFEDDPAVLPVVISDQLIEVFNTSVAPALGVPRLTGQTLTGFEFEVVFGRSLMLGRRGAEAEGVEKARIVGTSPFAMRLGATVPLATARRLMRTYAGSDVEETYGAVLLRAASPKDVPRIVESVQAMGLSVDESAQHTRDVLNGATALASLIGMLMLTLAALNIAHSFFASLSERAKELAILRAVGARRGDLVLLVLVQAAVLGLVGGVAGVLGAVGVAAGIDALAAQVLPDFPFKPETFFVMPPSLWVGALLAAVVAALAGALWPALRAAHRPMLQMLSEGA